MAQHTIYVRVEDEDWWQSIKNKSDFIHQAKLRIQNPLFFAAPKKETTPLATIPLVQKLPRLDVSPKSHTYVSEDQLP